MGYWYRLGAQELKDSACATCLASISGGLKSTAGRTNICAVVSHVYENESPNEGRDKGVLLMVTQ